MKHSDLLAPWIRRFLLEHLIGERNLSRHTQHSYRDALSLILRFLAPRRRGGIETLTITELSATQIRGFLSDLERSRHCGPRTQNQRLAVVHAFAHFIAQRRPEYWEWATQIRALPFRRCSHRLIPFLEPEEMSALLAAPVRASSQGERDYALLAFLYNTGARADEVTKLTIADLDFAANSARLHGKGNKYRCGPLWKTTTQTLRGLVGQRPPSEFVFLNCRGQPLTRFGVHTLVERHTRTASQNRPSLQGKRVSPHVIRHSTAMHLLRSGVDINTIRAWLGHASLQTTHIYAESDLAMKAKALAACSPPVVNGAQTARALKPSAKILQFLRSL